MWIMSAAINLVRVVYVPDTVQNPIPDRGWIPLPVVQAAE
jgi:hypothetical protein